MSAKWGRSGMIAPNSIASRKTIDPVSATMRRIGRGYVGGRPILADAATDIDAAVAHRDEPAPSGACRAAGGDPSGGIPLLRDPARGPKKMHRVGLASVQLTRSTFAEATAGRESLQPSALRARCTRKSSRRIPRASSTHRKRNCRKLRHIVDPQRFRVARARFAHRMSTQKRTEAGAPSSGFPTDLRRSDCLSESHQPQALRPRCNRDTTGSATVPSSGTRTEIPALCGFFFTSRTYLR